MKDSDYTKLLIFKHQQGLFEPVNAHASALCDNLSFNELVHFREVKSRDIGFHRAYFALISYIYDWLTPSFKKQVSKENFYNWLKILFGDYKVIFEFKSGEKLIEYKSISFGRMSQKKFEEYVKEQLPQIYEKVIHELYDQDIANDIIENIEETFETFLNNL